MTLMSLMTEDYCGDDVVESDHRVVGLRVEWVMETRKRGGGKKKRIIPEDKWEEFWRKVDEEIRQGKGVQESMCLVAMELAEAKQAWREYQEAKEEASAVMLKKMNETNRKGMQGLGRGAERNRNMFRELKNWMNKGKGKEELVEFLTEEGEAIKNEDEIVAEIEKVWGKLLNKSGEAVLGVEKERFEMVDGDREITPLFIGCQHHVLDRILRVVMDYELGGATKAPNIEYYFVHGVMTKYDVMANMLISRSLFKNRTHKIR
ncbi:hypothetical protein CAPTEDRAFT_211571 [Capitella teleta]|uniref:Uncharacterized protein n=1 Tax=Capitella teleta TaxID=283909 RepID=R7TNY0_CAPTE|nr:hypothetical protein CAPTEDRAFT_211571 [Capitella teleta]|eukprot:ELT95324.1 hypothetical protein CAPTEDRAFT_211571 [Capitella teleta]